MDDFQGNDPSEETPLSPQGFALAAVLFEALLAAIAYATGLLFDFPVSKTFELGWTPLWIGLAAAVPFILLFLLFTYLPFPPFEKLCRLLDELVVPRFKSCHLVDLAAISIAAGVGEEMLFRGLIQGYLTESIGGSQGIVAGMVVSSFCFALLHPMTLTYALIAGVISLYLGWIWLLTGNLMVPIVAHAFYDFVVLVYLARFRKPLEGEKK